ncbi:hypothetical protein IV203_004920 [Nitzschia inconspicua]|uniref:Uncharacterized protein n=1 Tax=Nitzschia inconspicua TaxID=303405 RepID=A0A9K3PFV8_9STRA|nr:hypothetical protein IV203_004920 [Nitzschia inconspicua]
MVGFVDDLANCNNDFTNSFQEVETLLHKAQQDAQLWNDLLDSSGGALEVRKCMFHLAHYQFTPRGAPVLQSFAPDRLSVQVQESGPHGTTVPIKYLRPTTSRKTLGCYKSPAGGYKQSLKAITENAIAKATLVAKSALDPKCAMRYCTSVFLPSVTYPFLHAPSLRNNSGNCTTKLPDYSSTDWVIHKKNQSSSIWSTLPPRSELPPPIRRARLPPSGTYPQAPQDPFGR